MEIYTKELLLERLSILPAHVVYGDVMGRSSWGEGMSKLVPDAHRVDVVLWVALGHMSGGFLTALMENNLMRTFEVADLMNARCIFDWVKFVHNYCPSEAHGSKRCVAEWRMSGGTIGQQEAAQ